MLIIARSHDVECALLQTVICHICCDRLDMLHKYTFGYPKSASHLYCYTYSISQLALPSGRLHWRQPCPSLLHFRVSITGGQHPSRTDNGYVAALASLTADQTESEQAALQ